MNEQEEKIVAKKFKSFKGIFIDRTSDYFICDFYRLEPIGNTLLISVKIELRGVTQHVVLKDAGGNTWKYISTDNDLPEELEQALSDHIVKSCL